MKNTEKPTGKIMGNITGNIKEKGGVLEQLETPSPLAGFKKKSKAPALDYDKVAALAQKGLDEEEIFTRLGLNNPLPVLRRVAFEAAMKRGRAEGRASIREAMFESAIGGKTQAQSQILKRLEGISSLDENEEGIEVERVILGEKKIKD